MKKLFFLNALVFIATINIFANEAEDTPTSTTLLGHPLSQSIVIDSLEQTTHAGFAIQVANQLMEARQSNQATPDYSEVRETLLSWISLIGRNPSTITSINAFDIVQRQHQAIRPTLPNNHLNANFDNRVGGMAIIINHHLQQNHNSN